MPRAGKQILIVDPCLSRPEVGAYNTMCRMFGELVAAGCANLSCVQFAIPNLGKVRVRDAVKDMNLAGIISLGSYANVTDKLPWVDELADDLRPLLFERGVPFLGICFSHQMLAHMAGNKVDYLRNHAEVVNGKHEGFRTIELVHPKLGVLFARLSIRDFGSGNSVDAAFRAAIRGHDAVNFACANSPANFIARVAHEQEVWELSHPDFVLAARSPECGIDGVVHKSLPIFSVQAHPETFHESLDGWRLIKNFMYFCSLNSQDSV